MAWSIFKQGGGKQVAVGWAERLLDAIGAPKSAGNIQFVYDWELAEGGGGKFNPLNQGPVPGHPELTSTGQQFGGGAADFVSWDAGITGAADYLNMNNYKRILSSLRANDPVGARSALIASPWAASHYSGGFPNTPVPGGTPVLPGNGTSNTPNNANPSSGVIPNPFDPSTWISGFLSLVGVQDMKDLMERLGLILLGAALIFIGLSILGAIPKPGQGGKGSKNSGVAKAALAATPEGRAAEMAGAV